MVSQQYSMICISQLLRQARFLIGLAIASLLLPPAQAQYSAYDRMPNVISADPAMQGYKVDNKPRRYKVHEDLPKRVSLRVAGDIDERYKLATLIADQQGSYENLHVKKIVVVDSVTGDIKPSPYGGSIKCFSGGNLALYIEKGRGVDKDSFQYGKYGEALQVWEDALRLPIDHHLI